jgi:hypothetical protein
MSRQQLRLRTMAAIASLAVAFLCQRTASADTLVGGFNGDLSTSLGTNWVLSDTDGGTPGDQVWGASFVTAGATEGTQALRVEEPGNVWGAGLLLNTPNLIPIVKSSNTLEFDATLGGGINWRALWVIMQGDGLNWAQSKQFDLQANGTVHAVIDLTDPAGDGTDAMHNADNWKAGATASGGTWWQILIAGMGQDQAPTADFNFDQATDGQDFLIQQRNIGNMNAGPDQGDTDFDAIVGPIDVQQWKNDFGRSSAKAFTIIDNIKFVGGAVRAVPEPASLTAGVVGLILTAMACRRGRH